MKSTLIFILLSIGTLFSSNVSASESLSSRQALVSGNFLIFEFVNDYYTAFKTGDKVIVGFKNDETHTKKMGTLKTHSYPNSLSEIIGSNLVSLWGAKFSLENDSNGNLCLFKSGTCYAHFKKTLFDTEFTRALFFKIINGSLTEMAGLRNQAPADLCPGVKAPYIINRKLGEALFRSVKMLDVIPYVDTHNVYVAGIQSSINHIQANYRAPYSQTAYYTCNNVSELMTGFLVTRGLMAFYRYSKSNSLKSYISRILNETVNSDHAITVRSMAESAPSYSYNVYANMHAQFLHTLVLRDELGLESLPIYTDGVVKNIVYAQSLNAPSGTTNTRFRYNQDSCQDSRGANWTLTFGGWAHGVHLWSGAEDCRQSMGYHVLTTNPLFAFQQKIENSSICSTGNFTYSCGQLSWSLRASIAYFMQANVFTDVNNVFQYYNGHAEHSLPNVDAGNPKAPTFVNGNAYGGTSHMAADFLYRALPQANWVSTPSGFNGERVSKADLEQMAALAKDNVINRNKNYSYLVSFAYQKLFSN